MGNVSKHCVIYMVEEKNHTFMSWISFSQTGEVHMWLHNLWILITAFSFALSLPVTGSLPATETDSC